MKQLLALVLILASAPSLSAEYAVVVGSDAVSVNAFPTEKVGVSLGVKKDVNPLTKNLAGSYCVSMNPDCVEAPYTSLGYFNSASSTEVSVLYKVVRSDKVDVYARLGWVSQPLSEVKEVQQPLTSSYNYQGDKKSENSVSGGIGLTYKFTDRFGVVAQYDSHLGPGVGVSFKF
jgi:hypothetical protein